MPVAKGVRKAKYMVPVAAVIVALAMVVGWMARRSSRIAWVHEKAVPEIQRLALEKQGIAAFKLLKEAERYAGEDTSLKKVKAENFRVREVLTEPAGAEIYVRDYSDTKGQWEYLGRSPTREPLPVWGFYAFQTRKDGYETVYATGNVGSERLENIVLDKTGALPAGMVRVRAGEVDPTGHGASTKREGFLIDKYEVTNTKYKKFVDAGGYQDPKYWKYPFVKGGKALGFSEAMLLLRDKTDRAGPATWEVGNFPEGNEDYPVSGVSWYEAAAYAEFTGKRLPTVYHWYRATEMGFYSDILLVSNFAGKGQGKGRELSRAGAVRYV